VRPRAAALFGEVRFAAKATELLRGSAMMLWTVSDSGL
jgi:hypothetical protein